MLTAFPSLCILAVEDDRIQARALRIHLSALGYDAPLEASGVTQAEALFAQHLPDLVLLDIHLGGGPDGIELAKRLRAKRACPIIFLTSAHDLSTFERASAAAPQAFLTKPYSEEALFRAIELAAGQRAAGNMTGTLTPANAAPTPAGAAPATMWLRDGSRMVRAVVADILYIEADGVYSHFHTAPGRKFTVRQSLRELGDSLPTGLFLRIHRGYLVQVASIESVDLPDQTVTIGAHVLPIGRSYREELVAALGM